MAIKAIEWVRRLRAVTPTQKLLLFVLADRVKDGEWETWVGQDAIAAEACLALRTVQRTMPELERLGLIDREARRRPDGYRTSDVIRLNVGGDPVSPARVSPDTESPDNLAGSSDQDIPTDSHPTDCHPTDCQVTSTPTSPANDGASYPTQWRSGDGKLEPEVEPETAPPALALVAELPSATDVATERFEEHFWPTYPKRNGKRLGKARSLELWLRMTVEDQRAAVMNARNYAAACATGLTMAKDPERWLQRRCWDEWKTPATPDRPVDSPAAGAFPEASARW